MSSNKSSNINNFGLNNNPFNSNKAPDMNYDGFSLSNSGVNQNNQFQGFNQNQFNPSFQSNLPNQIQQQNTGFGPNQFNSGFNSNQFNSGFGFGSNQINPTLPQRTSFNPFPTNFNGTNRNSPIKAGGDGWDIDANFNPNLTNTNNSQPFSKGNQQNEDKEMDDFFNSIKSNQKRGTN